MKHPRRDNLSSRPRNKAKIDGSEPINPSIARSSACLPIFAESPEKYLHSDDSRPSAGELKHGDAMAIVRHSAPITSEKTPARRMSRAPSKMLSETRLHAPERLMPSMFSSEDDRNRPHLASMAAYSKTASFIRNGASPIFYRHLSGVKEWLRIS